MFRCSDDEEHAEGVFPQLDCVVLQYYICTFFCYYIIDFLDTNEFWWLDQKHRAFKDHAPGLRFEVGIQFNCELVNTKSCMNYYHVETGQVSR